MAMEEKAAALDRAVGILGEQDGLSRRVLADL